MPAIRVCAHCDAPLERRSKTGPEPTYCPTRCRQAAYELRCRSDGRHAARLAAVRREPVRGDCLVCGEQFELPNSRSKFCSRGCYDQNRKRVERERYWADPDAREKRLAKFREYNQSRRPPRESRAKKPVERQCVICGNSFTSEYARTKACSGECRQQMRAQHQSARYATTPRPEPKPQKDMRSPLRKAWEDRDYEAFLQAVAVKTAPSGECQIWSRRTRDGYPQVRLGKKKNFPVHRMVLEAKLGAPLGVLAAHHKCGNSGCVNPDHLQPVTHAENTAEMLARQSYLARIEELESVVRLLAPEHDALNRVAA